MKIKKGDILYILHQVDISELDGECLDSYIDTQNKTEANCSDIDFDESLCPMYRKCWMKPQKVKLSIFRVSSIKTRIRPEGITYHMINKKDNTRNKVVCVRSYTGLETGYDKIITYAKSEKGAYLKFLSQLKKNIIKIEKQTEIRWKFKSRNIKSYISLKDRLEKKIKGWDNGKK